MRGLFVVAVTVVTLFAAVPAAPATIDPNHDPAQPGPTDNSPDAALDGFVYDMIFPIIGNPTYSDTFGACRGTNCSRTHNGIDMLAPKMTPIVAVADGVVGWMDNDPPGTENRDCCAMALRHTDGWESWYIHMNNDTEGTDDGLGEGFAEGIVPGAFVRAGQLIGWVGDSGNAESIDISHLHFELHDPDDTVINPFDSLNAAPRLSAPVLQVEARGCDFDADGYHDLAIGSPGEDLGAGGIRTDSGAVTVIYGSFGGLSAAGAQNWHYNSPGVSGGLQADARFGSATTCGDFDADGYDDLAIGAPGRDRKARTDAGAVTILYGSPGGLQAIGSNLFDLGSPGVREAPQVGGGFGAVLVAGDFDADGYDDLAVGAPAHARSGVPGSGIVVVLLGSPSGIDGTSLLLFDGIGKLKGVPEPGDGFGSALAAADLDQDRQDDLIVGIPGEVAGSHPGTGEVQIVPGGDAGFDKWRGRRLFAPAAGWVDTPNAAFGAAVTTGDLNGDGTPDLAVGAPGDGAGGVDAGTVRVFDGSADKWFVRAHASIEISRDSAGVDGEPMSGERFGFALTSDDFDADGHDDLAIGVPEATVGGAVAAGAVITVDGSPGGVSTLTAEALHQGNLGVAWAPSTNARFGSFLSSGDYAAAGVAGLAIGVPGQDIGGVEGAGAVHVIYGGAGGLDLVDIDTWREALGVLPGTSEPGDAWSALDSPSG